MGSAQSRLEAVSEATAALNEVKGKTLEEISKVVQEIQTQTKERKERLQPLIVKMRQMRTDVAELEQEHGRKKAVFDATAGSLGAEKSKLEAEVKTLHDECTLQESQIHVLQAQMQMTAMQLERVAGEAAGGRRERRRTTITPAPASADHYRYWFLRWHETYKRATNGEGLHAPRWNGPPVPGRNATHTALVRANKLAGGDPPARIYVDAD